MFLTTFTVLGFKNNIKIIARTIFQLKTCSSHQALLVPNAFDIECLDTQYRDVSFSCLSHHIKIFVEKEEEYNCKN